MSDQNPKLAIKLNFPLFLGLSFLAHLLLITFLKSPEGHDSEASVSKKSPLIVTIGKEDSKLKNNFITPPVTTLPQLAQQPGPKKLSLRDLVVPKNSQQTPQIAKPNLERPGKLPTQSSALSKISYGADDFKKLAQDPMLQGGRELISSDRVALNFELPKGKDEDDLNESQLKLYGFLRRGAMKYVASLSSEIKDFELQNPHLQFPLVDTKQVLTGRLVYDNQGNLMQIKMVRWSNNDKLQGFFEKVLKRLDHLQNPPKELWVESGEFTVFVTLQING